MTRQQRKQKSLQRALGKAQVKLAATRRGAYARERNFRRVLTLRPHVVGLEKRLRALSPASF